VVGKSDPYN